MKEKVIMVSGSREKEAELNDLVRKVQTETSMKAYPNVDYGAVFFPIDKHDLSFLQRVLNDKGFSFKVENAE